MNRQWTRIRRVFRGAGICAHLRRCGAEEETDERPVVAEPRCGTSKQRPQDRRRQQADGGRDASGVRLVVHAAPVRGDPDPRGRRHRRTDGGRAGPRPALQTAGSEESIPRGASHWPKEGENVRVWVEGGGWRRWGEGAPRHRGRRRRRWRRRWGNRESGRRKQSGPWARDPLCV